MTYLIGNKPYAKEVELYGADGRVLQLVGEAVPLVISNREEAMSNEEVLAEIKKVKAELAAPRNAEVALTTEARSEVKSVVSSGGSNMKKNHREVKAKVGRKYVRLGELKAWGKVPQQQADIAAIMAESMEVGAEWTEEEVFELLKDGAKDYASLRNSRQHVTYLFAYYRGLKNDGVHAGFVGRGFIRQVN